MNRTLALSRVLRKCGAGTERSNEKVGSDSVVFWIFTVLLAALMGFVGANLAKWSLLLGDPMALFRSFFFMGAVISLFLTFPGIVNNLYMSNDLTVLIVMPYTPMQLIFARLLNVSRLPFACSFVCSIAPAIGYAVTTQTSPNFWIAILLAFICVPLIVISLVGIVIIVIVSLVHGFRNKDLLRIVGVVVLFAIIVVFVVVSNNSSAISKEVISQVTGTMTLISSILPINFALEALMAEPAILPIAGILGITAAFVIAFTLVAKFFYFSSALSMQETSAGGKILGNNEIAGASIKQSVFRAYLKKDLKAVFREPAYLMSGILYPIFMPLVMVIVMGFAGTQGLGTSLETILQAKGAINNINILAWIVQNAMILTFYAAAANAVACCPLSREGQMLDILKTQPVPARIVLLAKEKVALIIAGIGSLGVILLGGLVLCILGYLPIWAILIALAINIPWLYFVIDFEMIHDLKKPKFSWETEADMLKHVIGVGSYVILFTGIIAPIFFALAILIVGSFSLLYAATIPAVIIGLGIILAIIEHRRMLRIGDEVFRKL